MTRGMAKVIADFAPILRDKFPANAGLTDEAIVAKYIKGTQVGHLANYYDELMAGIDRMKEAHATENE